MSFWKKKGDESSGESPAMDTIRDALNPAGQPKVSPTPVKSTSSGAPENASSRPTSSGTTSSVEGPEFFGSGSEKYGKIRSALGPGTVIQGKLSFDTPVRIDGRLSGEVYSTKPLIVGETGDIQADVQVSALIVMGKVSGNIKATERIEILKTGEISGEISTPALVIEEGARFSGACAMSGKGAGQSPKFANDDSSKKKKPEGQGPNQPGASAH